MFPSVSTICHPFSAVNGGNVATVVGDAGLVGVGVSVLIAVELSQAVIKRVTNDDTSNVITSKRILDAHRDWEI